MKRLILTLIIITGLFESCKKYEDGPCISLRSVGNRLYGKHILTTYTVNGVDSLSLFKDSLNDTLNFFLAEPVNSNELEIKGTRADGKSMYYVADWCFEKKKTILRIKYSEFWYSKGTGPFVNHAKPDWEILRLTNSEIKMKTNYNDKEYLIVLK